MDLGKIVDYGGRPIVLNRPYVHASHDLTIFREFGEAFVVVENYKAKGRWLNEDYVSGETSRSIPLDNRELQWRYQMESNPHRRKWLEEIVPTLAPSQFEEDIPNSGILK